MPKITFIQDINVCVDGALHATEFKKDEEFNASDDFAKRAAAEGWCAPFEQTELDLPPADGTAGSSGPGKDDKDKPSSLGRVLPSRKKTARKSKAKGA